MLWDLAGYGSRWPCMVSRANMAQVWCVRGPCTFSCMSCLFRHRNRQAIWQRIPSTDTSAPFCLLFSLTSLPYPMMKLVPPLSFLGVNNTPLYRHMFSWHQSAPSIPIFCHPKCHLTPEICSSDQRGMCKSALPESAYKGHFSPKTCTTLTSETTWVLGSDMLSPDRSPLRYRLKHHSHTRRSSDHLKGFIHASSPLNQGKQQSHQQGCGQQRRDSSC